MIEYRFYKKKGQANLGIRTLRQIYEGFIKGDKLWYFGLYGDSIKLRVSKRYPKLENYFRKEKVMFVKSDYNEDYERGNIVGAYFKELTEVFHLYAELSLKARPK